MTRDPDRGSQQPGIEHFDRYLSNVAVQFDAIAVATSLKDLMERLGACSDQ